MKPVYTSFFILIIILFFSFNMAAAGRYICVDKHGKEIECRPDVADKKKITPALPPHRTIKKPAGTPYQYHKKNNGSGPKK